jgi:hypothetical protein
MKPAHWTVSITWHSRETDEGESVATTISHEGIGGAEAWSDFALLAMNMMFCLEGLAAMGVGIPAARQEIINAVDCALTNEQPWLTDDEAASVDRQAVTAPAARPAAET